MREGKYTIEIVRDYLNKLGYELISKKYINTQEKLILRDKDGYFYMTKFIAILCNKMPDKFNKSNPYTIKNIKLWLKINNIELNLISDTYIGSGYKLDFADQYNYYYSISLENLQSSIQTGKKFRKVDKRNPYTIRNIKLWCKLNNKPFELLSNIYVNAHKKLKWECLNSKCGEIFNATWNDISEDKGCGYCASQQIGLSNCLATKNPELAKEWHPTLNGDLTPYHLLPNANKYAWWKCKDCGNEWESLVSSRNQNIGCPKCNYSKGEKQIVNILTKNNFIKIDQKRYSLKLYKNDNKYYITQKTFDNLLGVGNRLLSYDFYIPKYNFLIEYQGEYHDGTAGNQSKEDFEKQQEHDKRKKNYAIANGYNFLEIWYWDYDNIKEIIESKLKELSKEDSSLFI